MEAGRRKKVSGRKDTTAVKSYFNSLREVGEQGSALALRNSTPVFSRFRGSLREEENM